MKPLISFVMPSANTEFCTDAIKSIQKQTIKDWELLFFNNVPGRKVGFDDVRVKVFDRPTYSKESGGVGIARSYNEALEKANSDYILIVHDDDISFPERSLVTYHYLTHGFDAFYGSCLAINKDNKILKYMPSLPYDLEFQKKHGNRVAFGFSGFNRTKVPPFREDLPTLHDYFFNLQCGIMGIKFASTLTPLGFYRMWGENITIRGENYRDNRMEQFKKIREILGDPTIRKGTEITKFQVDLMEQKCLI